jgi:hypothetical protein
MSEGVSTATRLRCRDCGGVKPMQGHHACPGIAPIRAPLHDRVACLEKALWEVMERLATLEGHARRGLIVSHVRTSEPPPLLGVQDQQRHDQQQAQPELPDA